MLEVTNSQSRVGTGAGAGAGAGFRAGAEWPSAPSDTSGRRTSNFSYRAANPVRNVPDMFSYGFPIGESFAPGSDFAPSPLLQPFNSTNLNYFTNHQFVDRNANSGPVNYPNGLRYPSLSCSPGSNTLALNSPNSSQNFRGNNQQSPMESFSPISNDGSESQWTALTPQAGSDNEDMPMSEMQYGSFGTLNSMMMQPPSTLSTGLSDSYADVNAPFLPQDPQRQLNDLAFDNSLFPLSPSTSFNVSPTSPRGSEDFSIDPYTSIPDNINFNGISITLDAWSAAPFRGLPPNQNIRPSRNGVDVPPQVPWTPSQAYVNDYQTNNNPTGLSSGIAAHDPYSTTDDVLQSFLKPDPANIYGPEPLSPNDSWALVSRTNSDTPSFGSPCSHGSPEAHPISPTHTSQPEYESTHAHAYEFKNRSKISKPKLPKGRQRGLTEVEKKQARDVRDAKACWACHISKTKCSPCSPGRPCEQCFRLNGKRRFCNFTCFNDPLEALHRFMVPDYLMGHFTRQDVEAFVIRNTSGWGTEFLHIKMTWGFRRPLEAEVVALVLRSDSSEMGYQHQTIQNGTSTPTLVRKQSPPLGIPLDAMDELPDEYSRYIQEIVANDLAEYVPVAYTDQNTMLPERLLRAVCQFYHSESESENQSDLLRQAIEMHVTAVILERSLILDPESLDSVESHLEQEYPPRSAPRCAQRQIKLALFEHQQKRIMKVLKDWGNMMWATNTPLSKDKDWAISFSVFLILILVMDKTLGAAYFFCEGRIKNHGHEPRSEKAEFVDLVRLTQNELFDRCKEIFHWKFKTRKGGKEACNPIRDGVGRLMAKSGNAVDGNVGRLVSDIQEVVAEYEEDLKSPSHKRQGFESEYMDAGRLACIFLNDFVNR